MTKGRGIATGTGGSGVTGIGADGRSGPLPRMMASTVPTGTFSPGATIVLVPRAALRRDDAGPYVWAVDGERVRRRPVTVGTELGDQVQITAGLAGGETLVVGDATTLADGAPVKIAAADLANEKPIP